MARLDRHAAVAAGFYEYMAEREELRVAKWDRLDDGCSPFRYRQDRVARFRLGQPVEVEACSLPAWAPQKLLPPTGRVMIYPDDPGAPARL